MNLPYFIRKRIQFANNLHNYEHGYISAEEIIRAAGTENLSICDYLEKIWHQSGATQSVIDEMELANVFSKELPSVLEIGPGSGRYLEKLIIKTSPKSYEIYETAQDWNNWLKKTYPIISRNADGYSLKETANVSIDIAHAHGVFVYLPFLVSVKYFFELFRVVNQNGYVVFDICSEDCFDLINLQNWIKSDQSYPCIFPKNFLIELFKNNGFQLIKTFFNKYGQGKSEYFVFKKMESTETVIEKVIINHEIAAIIIPYTYSGGGTTFFTPNSFSQQLAFIQRNCGEKIQEHIHNLCAREIQYTQETLFIKKGKLKVNFYNNENKFITCRILQTGDVILLASGGHGFEFLEDTEMIEVKQGPYCGDQDKIRFIGEKP
jgi:hypothetical protein